MSARSDARLILLGGISCLVIALTWAVTETLRAQPPLRPIPAAPGPYGYTSTEPPLAGSTAPPQSAPSVPAFPTTPAQAAPASGPACTQDPPAPTVAIRVRVAATAAAGQELQYRLYIENRSDAPAHHVLVRDPVPANAEYVRATPEPSARVPELQWNMGTLAAGACKDILLVLRPTGTGDVQDCARVQFEHGQCVTTHIQPAATTQAPPPKQPPALVLQKHGPTAALRYEPLTYQLSVCNNGGAPVTGIRLVDTLPEGLELLDKKTPLTWDVGTLAAGKCHTIEYKAIAKMPGKFTNRVVAAADGGLKQEAASTVTITEAKVALDAAGPHARYVNTPTTFTLTVRNTGSTPLGNVVLNHPMPAGTALLRASNGGRFVGDGVQWWLGTIPPGSACNVQITWRSPQAGQVCLHPVVTTDHGLRVQTDVCTDFVAASALSFSVDDTDDPIEVGTRTTYRIAVVNQGQVPATHVRLVATAPPEMRIEQPASPYHVELAQDGHTITIDMPTIEPKQKLSLEVPVLPLKAGDVRFHVEMTADQLTSGRPVVEEESTTIYADLPSAAPRPAGPGGAAKPARP